MVTPPPIETTAAAKLIRPTVVTDQANRRRPGHNGMASTAEAAEPTVLAVRQMLAALPPLPPAGVAGWRGEVTIRSWQVLCTRLTMANPEHPRLIINDFLSLDLCKELEFIHKSCGTVGYRPNVFSTTLSHLIATNCGHLIMPFVPIRERLKEKAEEFFGCEFELFVEFTGLIRWKKGKEALGFVWEAYLLRFRLYPYIEPPNLSSKCTRVRHASIIPVAPVKSNVGPKMSNRTDPAWKYSKRHEDNKFRFTCTFCNKVVTGSVYRVKLHLAGGYPDVTSCPNCLEPVKEEIRAFIYDWEEEVFDDTVSDEGEEEDVDGYRWSTGASIGWHSDDNRTYLKQRDFADVVMYTADSRNMHSVDEITGGERLTLTLWFSRDGSHDEDAKLISFLSEKQLPRSIHETRSFLPQPASSRMYWFPPDTASTYESGFDICFARIHAHGYDLYSLQDISCFSASDSSNDLSEVLMAPLRLAREHELFDEEFVNILHVLQAVQFYCWKASELQTSGHEKRINVVPLSPSRREEVNRLKHVFLKDERVPDKLFSSAMGNERSQQPFNWAHVSAAVTTWEAYSNKLVKEMLLSLPYWKTHQSIFSVPSFDLGK
ncbi:hypothetical protein RHMOL_Rhmol09G0131500 [Rhododendron molle]|uniref:Uncharacterized protein n=1 Tax=Rhododendron molle TaxID=49168 RepID=A0ACC0MDH3_RHOML|nr:hypothetical protein RHMOL_Rhmol09G0131500 [Rhododendron molle]